jgi:hypothetical protein
LTEVSPELVVRNGTRWQTDQMASQVGILSSGNNFVVEDVPIEAIETYNVDECEFEQVKELESTILHLREQIKLNQTLKKSSLADEEEVDENASRATLSIQRSLLSVLDDEEEEDPLEEEFEDANATQNEFRATESFGVVSDVDVEVEEAPAKSSMWEESVIDCEKIGANMHHQRKRSVVELLDNLNASIVKVSSSKESDNHVEFTVENGFQNNASISLQLAKLLKEENKVLADVVKYVESNQLLGQDAVCSWLRRRLRRLYFIQNEIRRLRTMLCSFSLFISAETEILRKLSVEHTVKRRSTATTTSSLDSAEDFDDDLDEDEMEPVRQILEQEVSGNVVIQHGKVVPEKSLFHRTDSGKKIFKCIKRHAYMRTSDRELAIDDRNGILKDFKMSSKKEKILKAEISFSIIESIYIDNASKARVAIRYWDSPDTDVTKIYQFPDVQAAILFVDELSNSVAPSKKNVISQTQATRNSASSKVCSKTKAVSSLIAQRLIPIWNKDSTKDWMLMKALNPETSIESLAHEFCSYLLRFFSDNSIKVRRKGSVQTKDPFLFALDLKSDVDALCEVCECIFLFWKSRTASSATGKLSNTSVTSFKSLVSEEQETFLHDALDFLSALEAIDHVLLASVFHR